MGKGRGRHILVNKNDMPNWSETLESFRTARESWDLLHSHDGLEAGRRFLCSVMLSLHQKVVIRTAALIVHFNVSQRVQEDLRRVEDGQLAVVPNIPHRHDYIPGKSHF